MANVKTIGGSVVNTAGVPLPSKTVTLKNDDTSATITTTTTNADGEWEFADRDETLRYRAEAAFGGSSAQVVVRKPASAEFDHLYANLSFRSAAAAVVAFGGPVSVVGAITATGGLTVNGDLEVGGALAASGVISANNGVNVAFGNVEVVSGDVLVSTGDVSLSGALTANGGATVASGLTVSSGPTTLSGGLAATTMSGALKLANGTQALPGLSFAAETDLGFFRSGLNAMWAVNGSTLLQFWGANQIGWFGGVSSQPTITGSRGGNVALTNLLSALHNYGLIIDSTS